MATNFTCVRCGADMASLAEVEAHKCDELAREVRTKRDRINRLRGRLKWAKDTNTHPHVCAVLAGILDLLEDEL